MSSAGSGSLSGLAWSDAGRYRIGSVGKIKSMQRGTIRKSRNGGCKAGAVAVVFDVGEAIAESSDSTAACLGHRTPRPVEFRPDACASGGQNGCNKQSDLHFA